MPEKFTLLITVTYTGRVNCLAIFWAFLVHRCTDLVLII